MRKLLASAGLMLSLHTTAQPVRSSPHLLQTGPGAYGFRAGNPFSVLSNQASLAALPQMTGGIYSEKKYLLADLDAFAAVLALPVGNGGWAVALGYSGNDGYNESQAGIAYGRKLGRVDLGVQFNYVMIRIAGYGAASTVTAEAGAVWHVTGKLHTSIHIRNLYSGKWGHHRQEKIPFAYKTGLGYAVSEKLFISADIIKEEAGPVIVLAGMQYTISEQMFARLGIETATGSPFFGAGWRWKNIRVDVTGSYHPQLGLTPGVMLVFYGKEKEMK